MPITYDQAVAKLHEWTDSPALRCHARAVEAAMRLASHRYGGGLDETQWAITGLLHDADYDRWPADHPRLIVAWLREQGEPAIAQAVVAHFNPSDVPELTTLDKGLLACDELAGFVMACCMVRPDGIHSLAPSSVKKKLKDKSFAAKVSRNDVYQGAERLGVNLDDHIQLVIEALKPHAHALGIAGTARSCTPPRASSRRIEWSMTVINQQKNIYANLGIKTLINAQGTYTSLGGSLMPPEVVQAMAEAAGWFVPIAELQEKVGARIAGLLKVPAAMVTAGAASAITVATAACMTRDKPAAIENLPVTTGLKDEIVIQKSHKCGYEPQMLLLGAKLVWVETLTELQSAINPRTAMLFFLNRYEPLGQIKRQDWVRAGKERAVPVFNDAAADVPPAGRLSEYFHQGFDLVAFSGGKGLRGPQASGLLLGRADLIAAGRHAISPQMGIGRGMKVGKEEMMGLLAAVERFLTMDHEAEWRLWETRVAEMIELLAGIPGMNAQRDVPEIANHSPHLLLEWSRWHVALSATEVVQKLREGDPPIAALAEGEHGLRIAVWTLRDDEHRIVAKRIRGILTDKKS